VVIRYWIFLVLKYRCALHETGIARRPHRTDKRKTQRSVLMTDGLLFCAPNLLVTYAHALQTSRLFSRKFWRDGVRRKRARAMIWKTVIVSTCYELQFARPAFVSRTSKSNSKRTEIRLRPYTVWFTLVRVVGNLFIKTAIDSNCRWSRRWHFSGACMETKWSLSSYSVP